MARTAHDLRPAALNFAATTMDDLQVSADKLIPFRRALLKNQNNVDIIDELDDKGDILGLLVKLFVGKKVLQKQVLEVVKVLVALDGWRHALETDVALLRSLPPEMLVILPAEVSALVRSPATDSFDVPVSMEGPLPDSGRRLSSRLSIQFVAPQDLGAASPRDTECAAEQVALEPQMLTRLEVQPTASESARPDASTTIPQNDGVPASSFSAGLALSGDSLRYPNCADEENVAEMRRHALPEVQPMTPDIALHKPPASLLQYLPPAIVQANPSPVDEASFEHAQELRHAAHNYAASATNDLQSSADTFQIFRKTVLRNQKHMELVDQIDGKNNIVSVLVKVFVGKKLLQKQVLEVVQILFALDGWQHALETDVALLRSLPSEMLVMLPADLSALARSTAPDSFSVPVSMEGPLPDSGRLSIRFGTSQMITVPSNFSAASPATVDFVADQRAVDPQQQRRPVLEPKAAELARLGSSSTHSHASNALPPESQLAQLKASEASPFDTPTPTPLVFGAMSVSAVCAEAIMETPQTEPKPVGMPSQPSTDRISLCGSYCAKATMISRRCWTLVRRKRGSAGASDELAGLPLSGEPPSDLSTVLPAPTSATDDGEQEQNKPVAGLAADVEGRREPDKSVAAPLAASAEIQKEIHIEVFRNDERREPAKMVAPYAASAESYIGTAQPPPLPLVTPCAAPSSTSAATPPPPSPSPKQSTRLADAAPLTPTAQSQAPAEPRAKREREALSGPSWEAFASAQPALAKSIHQCLEVLANPRLAENETEATFHSLRRDIRACPKEPASGPETGGKMCLGAAPGKTIVWDFLLEIAAKRPFYKNQVLEILKILDSSQPWLQSLRDDDDRSRRRREVLGPWSLPMSDYE